MPVFRHLSTKVQRFALISKKKNEEMLKDWHFFEIFAKNIRMHYFCSRKRNDRPMTEEQIQEKKKYAGEKRPSMKGSTGDWYGCQFPKDENRETEAADFRFFSSGWCFCEKIIGETFAILNIICTFVAIRTDIKV